MEGLRTAAKSSGCSTSELRFEPETTEREAKTLLQRDWWYYTAGFLVASVRADSRGTRQDSKFKNDCNIVSCLYT
jgi:hypothetical protein